MPAAVVGGTNPEAHKTDTSDCFIIASIHHIGGQITIITLVTSENEHLGVARQPCLHSRYSQSVPLWITMDG